MFDRHGTRCSRVTVASPSYDTVMFACECELVLAESRGCIGIRGAHFFPMVLMNASWDEAVPGEFFRARGWLRFKDIKDRIKVPSIAIAPYLCQRLGKEFAACVPWVERVGISGYRLCHCGC